MADIDLKTLAERIDGVAWAVMLLTAELEQARLLDGDHYCKWLRDRAEIQLRHESVGSALMLEGMATQLDGAREHRQSRAHQAENQDG